MCKRQPSRGIYPAQPQNTKILNAMPKTAEAEQQTKTPCNATQQVVKLIKTQNVIMYNVVKLQTLSTNIYLRPILDTGALMSRLSFSSICFIGVPVPSAILRALPRRSRIACSAASRSNGT